MNKQDIATILAVKHGLPQKEADGFLTNLVNVLNDALRQEKQVKVKGLGTFKVTTVNARASVDVNTGERIVIEGRDKITFTPEASMRDWVNRPFSQFETVVINDGVNFDEIDAKYESAPAENNDIQPDEVALVDVDIKETDETVAEIAEESIETDDKEVVGDEEQNTSEPVAATVAPLAALVDIDDTPIKDDNSIITNNLQTKEETMKEESQIVEEENIPTDEMNERETEETVKPVESASQDAEPADEKDETESEAHDSANMRVDEKEDDDDDDDDDDDEEKDNVKAFDEYGYPTNKYQLQELKWQLKRSNKTLRILAGVLVSLVVLSAIGFFMLFREMSKKDQRIDGLVAEVLDLSRRNTEAYEAQDHMVNVDDINLTAEQAAQWEEIKKQKRQERQRRKKEIDDAYVKKMEDTRESVREQYRLREEQVAERMKRQKELEKAEMEREARTQAAKEKAAKEKAAKEKAVLEQLAREKAAKAAQEKAAQEKAAKEKAAREQAAKAAAQKQQAQKQQKATTPAGNAAVYNQDSRVRTGAYVITGISQTVTVRQGQTLSSISKAYLGPGMECYVEAVNGGIKEVSAGQKVKIPALKLKKKQ